MDHIFSLNIGDKLFRIHTGIPLEVSFPDNVYYYLQFEKQLTDPSIIAAADIEIYIKQDKPPLINHYRLLYKADSWSIRTDGTGYALTQQLFSADGPIWTAITDAFFSKITLYLSEQISPRYVIRNPLDHILLFHHLALRQGAIIHGAGMICNGKGYVFPGISGAGKTTLTNALTSRDDFSFLSDDRIIIRCKDDGYRCYGTPWPGDAGIAENKNAPLAGIFFLHQSATNKITEITPRQAFEQFMPVASIPWYHEAMLNALFDFFQQLVKDVPVFDFHFSPTTGLGVFFEQAIA